MDYTDQYSSSGPPENWGIPSKDGCNISIIMQGAYSDITPVCLRSLRALFPHAEIILSTWRNSTVDSLDADRIVFSEDPGAVYADQISKTLNNVNRQLVSTKAGLAVASRPFILKTRSDILFHSADFLAYFGKYDRIPSPYFQNRLLICNYYTRNPQVINICFHPSDWILFGRAKDVLRYYRNIPCMTKEEGEWFVEREKRCTVFTNYLCRYTPEQHIFLRFINQYHTVHCDCYYDHSRELAEETERAFANCFVVLDYRKHFNITFSKYDPNRYLEKHTIVAHWQWKALYRHYCQKRTSIIWEMYRAYGAVWKLTSSIRTFGIRVLNFLGIKETIKHFLTQLREP